MELQLELGEIIAKNSNKTTRRVTSAIGRIFVETYTIEDKLNIDAGKHVLVMSLN